MKLIMKNKPRSIELLSPAKDLDCAIAAVNCGADAVYMGASKFGARAEAGNAVEDIEKAVSYAHKFGVKIYITLNTILFDDELNETERLIFQVYNSGVDALIIQDMGLLEIDLPPISLIASTQAHNNSVEKIIFLEKVGFKQAILARELSLAQIRNIRSNTNIELESFIHGALCVSYSGRCYLSYALTGRSGNRGECSQPCRMTYNLLDSSGMTIVKDKHLLCLKDLNLSDHLSDLINSGISSLKIEGRLKDISYVKNIVSYYRQELDKILDGKNFKKGSGKSYITFIPNPYKTFNRGYTDYFFNERNSDMASLNTQKSTGEYIGKIKKVYDEYFTMNFDSQEEKDTILHNGDGICFFDKNDKLCGMFIDRVERERVYPHDIRWITGGNKIYRNYDSLFIGKLNKTKIERRIDVRLEFQDNESGFLLKAIDEDGFKASLAFNEEKIHARKAENAYQTIRKQLGSLGNTIFNASEIDIKLDKAYFIPVAKLNEMRRNLIKKLEDERIKGYQNKTNKIVKNDYPYPEKSIDFSGNILNKRAFDFFFRHGVKSIEPAAESGIDMKGKRVMATRYCIK